jgi:hypothetical protein
MPTYREYGHVPLLGSATFDVPTPSVRSFLAPSAPHHREADDNADHQGGGGEPATKRVKTEEGIIKAEEVEVDAAGVAGEGAMAEEDAMSEVKEEEAGRPPLLPVTESTPQRVAGASVLASLGGRTALPELPNPVDTAMAVDVEIMSDGNAMQQHDYLLQNLVRVSYIYIV